MEHRYRAPEPDYNIWWQVGLGVFLALMAHSIITGLYVRHEAAQAMRELQAETKRAEAQAKRQIDAAMAVANSPYQYHEGVPAPRPLADGERCISGKRFQRVENGWVQLPREPC